MALPRSNAKVARFGVELVILDALKIAYNSSGHQEYLDAFHNMRDLTIALMNRPAD